MSRVRGPYARFCERDKYGMYHCIPYLPYSIIVKGQVQGKSNPGNFKISHQLPVIGNKMVFSQQNNLR